MEQYINSLLEYCEDNKYFKTYVSIIRKSFNRNIPELYEKHHILPRCFKLGGENDKNNISILTPREHFVCHKLLVKCVNDKILKSKLSYAVWQITKRYKIKSREYEYLKKLLSETYKGIPKSESAKNNMRKPKSDSSRMGNKKGCKAHNKGIPCSEETKIKISKAKAGKCSGENNSFYGKKHKPETIKKLSERFKGIPLSEKHKENISKGSKGKIPWNTGKKLSESHVQKCSAALKDRKVINNGLSNKRVKEENLKYYLIDGWKLGMLERKPKN